MEAMWFEEACQETISLPDLVAVTLSLDKSNSHRQGKIPPCNISISSCQVVVEEMEEDWRRSFISIFFICTSNKPFICLGPFW